MTVPNNNFIYITEFSEYLAIDLGDKLSTYLVNTISNMIAIDYQINKKTSAPPTEYITKCCQRLSQFLNGEDIYLDDFGAAITLFAIAISDDDIYQEDIQNYKAQSQETEVISEFITNDLSSQYGISKEQEIYRLKVVIKHLLTSESAQSVANFCKNHGKELTAINLNGNLRNSYMEASYLFKNNKVDNSVQKSGAIGLASAAVIIGATTLTFGASLAVIIPAIAVGSVIGGKVSKATNNTPANSKTPPSAPNLAKNIKQNQLYRKLEKEPPIKMPSLNEISLEHLRGLPSKKKQRAISR